MSEFLVPSALAGERVDRVVALVLGCTRARASELIAAGEVRIANEVVTARTRHVEAGEVLAIAAEDPVASAVATLSAEEGVEYRVVYVDEAIIVVDKPAGLVVHPGAGNATGTLAAGLLREFPDLAGSGAGSPERPGIVHRLDKDTSGLLIVARDAVSYASLVEQLANRTMGRRYEALAWGAFAADAGVIDAPIGRSRRHPTRMAVDSSGREARTHYVVLKRFAGERELTHLEARLETGRTHQIRVHLAAIEHPIVGDRRYGGNGAPLGLGRPFLHASGLRLSHPTTGEELEFSSPLPEPLAGLLRRLESGEATRS